VQPGAQPAQNDRLPVQVTIDGIRYRSLGADGPSAVSYARRRRVSASTKPTLVPTGRAQRSESYGALGTAGTNLLRLRARKRWHGMNPFGGAALPREVLSDFTESGSDDFRATGDKIVC
jgi:hypothetical protein